MTGGENRTLTAARAYLARGLSVFPLNGKIPTTDHGVKDASDDEAQVVEWFPRVRNIAIAIPPGVVVVDVDPRNGGDKSLDDLWYEHGRNAFDYAPHAKTGAGGDHYWFRYDGRRLKKNPAEGIDLLTHGRYVVAPPSTTADTYRWERALPDVLPENLGLIPYWLLELATPEQRDPLETRRPLTVDDPLNEAAHRMTTWNSLLLRHGWVSLGDTKWRHPSSDNPISATIKHDCLFVYSPNTPFEVTEPGDPHGVTLYRALETLEYGGDRQACLQALRHKGHLPERITTAAVQDLLAHKQAKRNENGDGPRLVLRDLTDIKIRRVRWLWDGYVPLGGLTLLAGQPSAGKSTITFDLMASITRGVLPGELHGHPHDAIIVATEDSFEHTIVPRLLAAGADIRRVWRVDMLDTTDVISLPVDLPDLEKACRAHPVALVVLDPLISRLSPKLDSHKDLEVRQALEPLSAFAGRIGAAVIGLIHLNKSGRTDPLDVIMASKAFTAVARSVLHAMVDPEDPTRHLLGLGKSNLGPIDLPTLTYTFDVKKVGEDDGDIEATKVVWGAESTMRITDALQVSSEDKGALGDAVEWLKDWIAMSDGGSVLAGKALSAGKSAGHAERTLRRARDRLGIVPEYVGAPPTVWWALPEPVGTAT